MAEATNVPVPAPPTLINTTATELDAFIAGLIKQLNPAINAAIIAAIDAAEPVLAAPVISTIVDGVEEAVEEVITAYISKQVQLGATFIVVDIQTAAENLTLDEAEKALVLAQATGDPNAIAQAEQDVANAQSALTRDDGGAVPQ